MITLKPIIITTNRRKDGTWPVKIRVTYKGVSRRVPTTLVCTASDLTRSLHIKSATILAKAEELIVRMRDSIADLTPYDLEGRDVDWVVQQIKERLCGESFNLDFFEWADRYTQTKGEQTRRAYTGALNALERFLGCRHLDINSLTRGMLLDFMEFVNNEPKIYFDKFKGTSTHSSKQRLNAGMSARHLAKLQNIYNAAKDRYNDEDRGRILIPRSPFDKIQKHFPPSKGQKNLGVATMQAIISAQVTTRTERAALDVFVLSFGLMGANMADLYTAQPFRGEWIYNRQKTRTRRADQAEMRVPIPEELQPFITRLQDAEDTGWWLPVLHQMARTKDYATAKVNDALHKWSEARGLQSFTFYAARHTWATLARKAGVEKATIDECLCHKGEFTMTDIYAERSWELMAEANKKVLALFDW